MKIIETLNMSEIEELVQLTGTKFSEILTEGVELGRPMACLAWILEKRTNKEAKLDQFLVMNTLDMREYIQKQVPDPKATTTSD